MGDNWIVRDKKKRKAAGATAEWTYTVHQRRRGVNWRSWFYGQQKHQGRVVKYESASSRVASLTIKINKKYQMQVIQVYAPTSSHDDKEVEEMY